MGKNIFEGAKFGDKFLTRDNRIAILWRISDSFNHKYILVTEDGNCCYCNEKGEDVDDYDDAIVSGYKDSIDEEKLDELAKEKYPEDNEFYFERSKYIDGWVDKNEGKRKAFKAGYRKAKEE